ncbi:hypothetical protein [Micromonospora globbae]|uniref:hypothetical protein n=1 Tax=Micromonospora globbae TaxID=1894969 RepID=UPI00341348D3|nr:hypothetical protein OH732_04745 [Micromonospora globbae]
MRVAGIRWVVEDAFQAAKGQAGPDQHQVRRWNTWRRFSTLPLAALAILAICAYAITEREDPHLARHDPAAGPP